MKRIRIIHKTEYLYNQPVKFGPHRAMMRPREGHDAHIARAWVNVEPKAEVSWLRDANDNSIAILTFQAASNKLSVESEVDVDLYYDSLNEWPISPYARCFPFQYPPEEHIDLMVYRLPSYPYDGPLLQKWLQDLYQPGQVIDTLELLNNLNSHIYRSFKYDPRDALGVQLPNETLRRGSGTCRDYAVFMMEAARYWGFGARFVTGYIHAEGQHGATHLGQRSTSPAPDGAASIPQITNLPATNISPSAFRVNKRRLLRFPVHGTVRQTPSTE